MQNQIGFFTRPYAHVRNYFDMIDETVAHGLQVVEGFNECDFAKPDLEAARRIRDYADEKGVRFCCFSCFSDLTGDKAEQTVRDLKGYAQVAEILGAPYLHHTVVPEHNNPGAVLPQREQLMRQGAGHVREIFDFAAEHGVRAVYEDQGYAVNGVRGFGEFLELVDRPVGVVADFGNICQVDESIVDFLKAYADRVVHAHLKDYVVLPVTDESQPLKTLAGKRFEPTTFGSGIVPFREGIRLLKQVGYTGCYSLEFSNASSDIKAALAQVRQWLSE